MIGTTFKLNILSLKTVHIFSLISYLSAVLGLVSFNCCSPNVFFKMMRIGKATAEIPGSTFKYYNTAAEVSTEVRALSCLVELVRKVPFQT